MNALVGEEVKGGAVTSKMTLRLQFRSGVLYWRTSGV